MSYFIEMPRYGANMEEGTIGEWLVADGDRVNKGDPVCMIEIEKLTNEVLAEEEGILKQILEEGETADCGTVIGSISAEGDVPEVSPGEKQSGSAAVSGDIPAQAEPPAPESAQTFLYRDEESDLPSDVILTPKAVKLWEEWGRPGLSGIKGSGYGEMVTRDDLRAFTAPSDASGADTPAASVASVSGSPATGTESSEMSLVKNISFSSPVSEAVAYAALKALAASPALRVFSGVSGRDLNNSAILCTVVDGDNGEGLFLMEHENRDLSAFRTIWTDLYDKSAAGLMVTPSEIPSGILRFYDASSQGLALFQPGLNGLGGMSLTLGAPQSHIQMGAEGFQIRERFSLCLTVDSSLISRKSAITFLNRIESLLKELSL